MARITSPEHLFYSHKIFLILLLSVQYLPLYHALLIPPALQNRKNPIFATEGDLNLAYLADILTPTSNLRDCTNKMSTQTCTYLSTAVMAIDKINNSTDLLPNITLGLVIADSCYIATKALEVSLYFVKEAPQAYSEDVDKDGQKICEVSSQRNGSVKTMKTYDVVGIIGPALTEASIAISPLMGIYNIPMIGLYPTSDVLDDKKLHPYFTRLVAPDGIVVEGLLDIAEHLNWTYISLIYDSSDYGQNAAAQVDRLIRRKPYNICIAISLKIPTDATYGEYEEVVNSLIENSKARVIITFTTPNQQDTLANKLNVRIGPGYFLWLGSNTLVAIPLQSLNMPMLEGSIFLDHINAKIPDYDAYMSSPAVWNKRITWFIDSWQREYNCTFPITTDGSADPNVCTFDPKKVAKVCSYDGWVGRSRTYDAAMIYASALHRLINDTCPDAWNNKTVLRPCVRGDLLLKYILNTSMDGLIGKIEFNKFGDVVEQFSIKQFQRDGRGEFIETDIGRWDERNRLNLDGSSAKWDMFKIGSIQENTKIADYSLTKISPIESLCSKPCKPREYIISQSSICCWNCAKCRDNEIVSANRSSCQFCPLYQWPDPIQSSTCKFIDPTYLQPSNPISVTMLSFATLAFICSLTVITVYLIHGQHKLVKATSRQLCMVILCGTLLACVGVILFTMKPSISNICRTQGVIFHLSINLVYAPLLVKNIRIYRVFAAAQKGNQKTSFSGNAWQIIFTVSIVATQLIIVICLEAQLPSVKALKMPSSYDPYVELYCSKSTATFLIPLSFNILIIIICSVIGFVTRKLPDNFNESWFIFISTTTTLFSWAVFIPAYFTMFYAYLQSVILGFSLLLVCFVTLGCQFGPVLYAVAFVPNERIKFTVNINPTTLTGGSSSVIHPGRPSEH